MDLISIKDTCRKLSVGRTLLWQMMKDPSFPAPVSISVGRKAFVAAELDAWIASRAAQRPERAA